MPFHHHFQRRYAGRLKKSLMLRSFDLFAGIGGFRLAFENVFKKNNHRKILVLAPLLLVSILLPGKDECTYYSQISYEK